MSSPAMRAKIAKARAEAPRELPKARLCAEAILAAIDGEEAILQALQLLKHGLGNNWSITTAMQYMSGRKGEFAADCADPQEKPRLYLAHLIAKQVCSENGLGAVTSPDGIDVAKLKALSQAVKDQLQ
ncbi:hypothetical protein BV908_18425 [Diaphorobacter sp. LR2014-1]|nr:hypothetical protein BV908_18425 [Diaphorobacter sp. LR2014-1]